VHVFSTIREAALGTKTEESPVASSRRDPFLEPGRLDREAQRRLADLDLESQAGSERDGDSRG